MRKLPADIIVFAAMAATLLGGPIRAEDHIYTFGPQETKMVGSIKYSVIGKYYAQFDRFKGKITVDKNAKSVKAVSFQVEVASIRSNCDWCDKIVRSQRLLDAETYPFITFKSSEITEKENGYEVKGVLDMHGVKKELRVPFEVIFKNEKGTRDQSLVAKGAWLINRKLFNVTWNKVLDKGGVLVGNHFLVDWQIDLSLQ